MKKTTLVSLLGLLFVGAQAFAQTPGAAEGGKGLIGLGLGLMLGLAGLGATLGQGKVGSSAMEGLARNPQARTSMFVPMILGLVFIESLFMVTLVFAFIVSGKI